MSKKQVHQKQMKQKANKRDCYSVCVCVYKISPRYSLMERIEVFDS